jgi:hypothetical protein
MAETLQPLPTQQKKETCYMETEPTRQSVCDPVPKAKPCRIFMKFDRLLYKMSRMRDFHKFGFRTLTLYSVT